MVFIFCSHTEKFIAKKKRYGAMSPKTPSPSNSNTDPLAKEPTKLSIKAVRDDLKPSAMFNFTFEDLPLEHKIKYNST